MKNLHGSMSATLCLASIIAICVGVLTAGQGVAGGLIVYEIGTADVGLASAGYGARAQDASTVFTNPAGMTRRDGTQVLAADQVLWANTEFSIGSGTSAATMGATQSRMEAGFPAVAAS